MSKPLRIANCSGYFGDRLSAAREMVTGGPIDILSGDWLAELTMFILAKGRRRDPDRGYARTFVTQMEQVLGECLDRGIRVVSNAGGLEPRRCARAVERVAADLGLAATVAYVEGDDLLPRISELRASGVELANLDTGERLPDRFVLTANAYIGGWGIADALGRGADVVIAGRCSDASLVVGPAAWHHAWSTDNWDALAGAVVAGHVIECGTQATGGNYSFFTSVPGADRLGFPIAEVAADGSSVITKHDHHGGQVTTGTVTAQLLYEIAGPRYANPDVTARFDSVDLIEEAPNRIRIRGVRGEAPPDTLKVCLTLTGGWRSTVTVMLSGLDITAKAAAYEAALWNALPRGRATFDAIDVELIRSDREDPESMTAALAQLRITVKGGDEDAVRSQFPQAVNGLALASFPGLFWEPPVERSYGTFWPAAIPSRLVQERVVIGRSTSVPPSPERRAPLEALSAAATSPPTEHPPTPDRTVRVPLGLLAGARSGDKGGNANVGIWVDSDVAYAWLDRYLTVDRIRSLLQEAAHLPIERHAFPNLRALNFVIVGLLGEGVSSSSRVDAQAKSLGEYLRARHVEIPTSLLRTEEVELSA